MARKKVDGADSRLWNLQRTGSFSPPAERGVEGQGADCVKRWLEEIRRTPLSRTNSGTVLAAYQKLTGKDLAAIIAEVVK